MKLPTIVNSNNGRLWSSCKCREMDISSNMSDISLIHRSVMGNLQPRDHPPTEPRHHTQFSVNPKFVIGPQYSVKVTFNAEVDMKRFPLEQLNLHLSYEHLSRRCLYRLGPLHSSRDGKAVMSLHIQISVLRLAQKHDVFTSMNCLFQGSGFNLPSIATIFDESKELTSDIRF